MANLQIKNVPDELHAELRRRVRLEGVTLREYVLTLLRRDQLFPTRREWLKRLDELEPVQLDRRAYELIGEDQAQRDQEFVARRHSENA